MPNDFVGIIKYIIRAFLGMGEIAEAIRRIRSSRYLKRTLNLTNYRFFSWDEAPSDIGVDLIVVGSDQVWRCTGDDLDVRPYLLVEAPNVPAISYAASIGMHGIPEDFLCLYKEGLKKFRAISTREEEAAKIIHSLGYEATHVMDPTLLDEEFFRSECEKIKEDEKLLVVYVIHLPVESFYKNIRDYCKTNKCRAIILVAGACREFSRNSFKDFVYSLMLPLTLLLHPCVKLKPKFGPVEFYRTMAKANRVITDSFHGTMFSAIFRKNVRILQPTEAMYEGMFSRMSEFVRDCIKGRVVVSSIRDALQSFERDGAVSYDNGVIINKRSSSLRWLREAIKTAMDN